MPRGVRRAVERTWELGIGRWSRPVRWSAVTVTVTATSNANANANASTAAATAKL